MKKYYIFSFILYTLGISLFVRTWHDLIIYIAAYTIGRIIEMFHFAVENDKPK